MRLEDGSRSEAAGSVLAMGDRVRSGREVKAIERNVDYHKSDTFKMTFNVMYVDSY